MLEEEPELADVVKLFCICSALDSSVCDDDDDEVDGAVVVILVVGVGVVVVSMVSIISLSLFVSFAISIGDVNNEDAVDDELVEVDDTIAAVFVLVVGNGVCTILPSNFSNEMSKKSHETTRSCLFVSLPNTDANKLNEFDDGLRRSPIFMHFIRSTFET